MAVHILILVTDKMGGGGGGEWLFLGHSDRLLCQLMISNCPSFLYFQYVYVQGGNPGVDFDFKRVVQPSDTPPENKFEWVTYTWSACSTTCGQGTNS